jgi:hypothetical protein
MRRLRRPSVATLRVLTRACRPHYRADRREGLGVVFWGTRKKDSKGEPKFFITKFSSACEIAEFRAIRDWAAFGRLNAAAGQ